MGNYEYASTIGSGTLPHVGHGPTHSLSAGAYPVPSQRESLRTRRGDGTIILNPEDFSVSIGLRSQAITITAAATPLPANPLENRRALVIHNVGSATVYIGNSTVTIANGLPLLSGEKIAFDIQGVPNVSVYAITAGSVEVRILELS